MLLFTTGMNPCNFATEKNTDHLGMHALQLLRCTAIAKMHTVILVVTGTANINAGCQEASAVVQVLEGGQIVVHELLAQQPTIFTLPFQGGSNITTTDLYTVPSNRPAGRPSYSLCLSAARRVAVSVTETNGKSGSGLAAAAALGGGVPPKPVAEAPCGTIYCTGELR